jgi:phosphoenolpyruvate synthase/pyruvate phosphate dikinase
MAELRKRALAYAEEMNFEPLEIVFFLTMDEICRMKKPQMASSELKKINKRKTAWEKSKSKQAFKEIRIYANGRKVKVPYLYGVGTNLQGAPLSSGKYKGKAKIILNPNDMDVFEKGDILVAPSTNPSWTPLFGLAGAIVTDMGNYLSHGSIVAREMGIPAVGNLFNATKIIKNGNIIEVNGDTGRVTLT